MTLANPTRKKRTTIATMALSVLTFSATLLATGWNQAQGTGFGTVDWMQHIFAAQKKREEGEIGNADVLLNQAFVDARRLGKQHPFYSITLRHLSDAAFYKYNFKASRDYAQQELEILKPLGDDFQDLVPVFIRLSDIAYLEGNLEEATIYANKAKTLRDKALFNPTLKAEIKLRLAMIELAKNRKTEFRLLVDSAEKDWTKMLKEAKAGSNLSEYASEVGKLSMYANKKVAEPMREAARYMGERSVFLIQKYQGVETLGMIWGLRKLGEIYRISGRPLDEIACFKRGSAYTKASSVLSTKDKAIVLYQYGQPLVDGGHLEEALPMLRQAEVYCKKLKLDDYHADILFYLSNCLSRLNKLEEALVLRRELVGVYEQLGRYREAQQQLREIDALNARIK